jgi:hypothetical protein
MVAPVSSHDGARCYLGHLGHLGSTWYLIHGPRPPHPFADFTRKFTMTWAICRLEAFRRI